MAFSNLQGCVGCNRGEIREKIVFVEEAISLLGGEAHLDKKYFMKSSNLFPISLCYSAEGVCKT